MLNKVNVHCSFLATDTGTLLCFLLIHFGSLQAANRRLADADITYKPR